MSKSDQSETTAAGKGRKALFRTLRSEVSRLEGTTMRALFAADPERFEKFSASCGDLLLDFSKNRVDAKAMAALFDLARTVGLEARRDAMWRGEAINTTENRVVGHMALRYAGDLPVTIGGRNVMPDVRDVLARMRGFTEAVRDGGIRGSTGEQFTDVVNIGIGGSDLGPAMVTLALEPYTRPDLRAHDVSNVDGAHIHDTLKRLNPSTTLFIVASKTFTTDETMINAGSARKWLADALGDDAV